MISETVGQVPRGARVTLLATPITYESRIYQEELEQRGVNFVFEAPWMPRILDLISTIKAATEPSGAKEKWLRLQEELLQRGVTTAVVACTDLRVVTDTAARGIQIVDSGEALAAAVVREYCGRRRTIR